LTNYSINMRNSEQELKSELKSEVLV